MAPSRSLALVLAAAALAACSDSSPPAADLASRDLARADRSPGAPDAAPREASPPADSKAQPDANPCPRPLAAADRTRYVVVSHPFTATSGTEAPDFEVLSLSKDGKLGKTGKTFQLGVATSGEIVFTPDGEVGLVPLKDGTVGVFKLDASGTPKVVQASLKTTAWADRLVVDPEGDRVYLLSTQWRNNGGGIYRLRVGCDGTVTDEGLVTASKLPAAMIFLAGGARVALAAMDVLTSAAGADAHLLDWGAPPTLVAGADAFGDDEAIVSSMALTRDGRYLLLADSSMFAGKRLAAVEVQTSGLRAAQLVTPFADPAKVITSPHSDVALVLEGEGDSIKVLDYHPTSASAPFTIRGSLTVSSKVQLPFEASRLTQGQLAGRVIIAENVALRQVQLAKDGSATEIELFSLGTTEAAIPGALGVQP